MYSFAILALASVAAAQSAAPSTPAAAGSPSAVPTSITPEQSSRIAADFASYGSALATNQYVSSLGQALNTWLPVASWDNWNAAGFASAPTSTNYIEIATATPTYSYPSWMTYLPGSLASEWGAYVTSVSVAHESIVRNALGFQAISTLPGPSAGVVQGPSPTANTISVNTNQPNVAAGSPANVGAVAGLAAIMGLIAL